MRDIERELRRARAVNMDHAHAAQAREAETLDLHECEGSERFRTANDLCSCLMRAEREAADLEATGVADVVYSVAAKATPGEREIRSPRVVHVKGRDARARRELADMRIAAAMWGMQWEYVRNRGAS